MKNLFVLLMIMMATFATIGCQSDSDEYEYVDNKETEKPKTTEPVVEKETPAKQEEKKEPTYKVQIKFLDRDNNVFKTEIVDDVLDGSKIKIKYENPFEPLELNRTLIDEKRFNKKEFQDQPEISRHKVMVSYYSDIYDREMSKFVNWIYNDTEYDLTSETEFTVSKDNLEMVFKPVFKNETEQYEELYTRSLYLSKKSSFKQNLLYGNDLSKLFDIEDYQKTKDDAEKFCKKISDIKKDLVEKYPSYAYQHDLKESDILNNGIANASLISCRYQYTCGYQRYAPMILNSVLIGGSKNYLFKSYETLDKVYQEESQELKEILKLENLPTKEELEEYFSEYDYLPKDFSNNEWVGNNTYRLLDDEANYSEKLFYKIQDFEYPITESIIFCRNGDSIDAVMRHTCNRVSIDQSWKEKGMDYVKENVTIPYKGKNYKFGELSVVESNVQVSDYLDPNKHLIYYRRLIPNVGNKKVIMRKKEAPCPNWVIGSFDDFDNYACLVPKNSSYTYTSIYSYWLNMCNAGEYSLSIPQNCSIDLSILYNMNRNNEDVIKTKKQVNKIRDYLEYIKTISSEEWLKDVYFYDTVDLICGYHDSDYPGVKDLGTDAGEIDMIFPTVTDFVKVM